MGLMLPHRTPIYTIRYKFPSTHPKHSFPMVFRATILCKTIRDLGHDTATNSMSLRHRPGRQDRKKTRQGWRKAGKPN